MTYHFQSLHDLLIAAFTRPAERTAARYAEDLGAAGLRVGLLVIPPAGLVVLAASPVLAKRAVSGASETREHA